MADAPKSALDLSDWGGMLRHRDRIKQELKALSRVSKSNSNSAFALDPTTLKPVTGKIGAAAPSVGLSDMERTQKQADVELLRETIARKTLPPARKFDAPPTASMDYGWLLGDSRWAEISKPYSMAIHKASDIIEHGREFSRVFKAGPFDKTQPIARGRD